MGYTQCQWTLALAFLTNAVQVWCFLPSLSTSVPDDTYSHAQITDKGVKDAAAKFLKDNGLVEGSDTHTETILNQYFGQDDDNKEKFNMRIQDLTLRMNKVQQDFEKYAKYTVNGERIEDAFNQLNILSTQTRAMISVDPFDTGAQESTLDNLAKALLIIQSFYSNTNWVEMNGDVHCPAFGEGGDLPATVLPWKETCSNCNLRARDQCISNILTNVLTSGYRPGQDATIPPLNTGQKCAHGWNTDNNGLAIGGIGKDTTDYVISPHAKLHPYAARAAMRGTTAYLYQNGKGVLSNISIDNFKKLLCLNSSKNQSLGSMTFVLDVSGSMGDDIAAAKDSCINKVSAVQGTSNEPVDYVLATFNDPENLTTGHVHTNGNDMINKLKSLGATGGGDCPEYAMSGIMKAISLSKNGSNIYVFTDADAKDGDRARDVNELANARGIKITFLLTGSCSRRRRAAERIERAVDDVYTQIAEATGGQVYHTNKNDIFSVLSAIIQEDMPSSDVLVNSFQMSPTTSDRKVVVVDSTINLLKIDVGGTGRTSLDDVIVEDPNGNTLRYNTDVARRYSSKDNVIISVQKPIPGNWTIIRSATKMLSVNATGSSQFDFTYQLLEKDERGIAYVIQGNPITGYNYTLSSDIFHLHHNTSEIGLSFVNLFGNEVERFQVSLRRFGSAMYAAADVSMPSERVRVQLTGILPDGEHFQRTNPQVISPVNVKLRLRTILDPIPFNKPQNITYLLGNYGAANQTFVVDIETDFGRLATMRCTLDHREFKEYNFQVIGQLLFTAMKYTVSVKESSSDVVLQSLSGTVWFDNPVCEIIYAEGSCPETVTPPASCDSITWYSQCVLSADVTSYNITTRNANVEIREYDTTLDGKVYLNVSSDCCSPSVYLSTIGSDNLLNGQCHFNFGSLPTFTTIKESSAFTVDWTLFVCIFGAVAIYVLLLMVVMVWHRRRTGRFVINDNNIDDCDTK